MTTKIKKVLTNLEKAKAMKCFGGQVELVTLDPDPETKDKLMAEFNCMNCDYKQYCDILTDTLK